jgi:hypothetical protein
MKEKSLQRIFKEDAEWADKEAKKLSKNAVNRESVASVIHRAIELYKESSK